MYFYYDIKILFCYIFYLIWKSKCNFRDKNVYTSNLFETSCNELNKKRIVFRIISKQLKLN